MRGIVDGGDSEHAGIARDGATPGVDRRRNPKRQNDLS